MMKSIVEEASTLEKAIAQAWKRAGNPKKFTVTIFQEAEKNFFGMTTLPAKIGFMYEESAIAPQKIQPKKAPEKIQPEVQVQPQQRKTVVKNQRPPQQQPQQQPLAEQPQEQTEKKDNGRFWTPEMIDSANQWLKETLSIAGKSDASFNIKASRYHLKIQFDQPVFDDLKREKAFFRSCALLIMQAQRALFKKSLKFHKIILMSN